MTDEEAQAMRRENGYLKARISQLEADVTDLGAELTRLRQVLESTHARRAEITRPNPLSGGQS